VADRVLKKKFHMLGAKVLVCGVLLLKGEISTFPEGDTVGQNAKNMGTNLLDTHVMTLGLQTDQDGGR
jgi:hypothetical protein